MEEKSVNRPMIESTSTVRLYVETPRTTQYADVDERMAAFRAGAQGYYPSSGRSVANDGTERPS